VTSTTIPGPSPPRRRSHSRLSLALVALLFASILIPLFIFAAVAWHSYRGAFDTAASRGQQIANLLEEHAHSALKTIELALRHADERSSHLDWETIRTSRALWTELRTFQVMAPPIGSLFVMAPDGTNVLTTREFPSKGKDFSDRDYFLAQKEADRGIYVSQSYTGRISALPIFNLSIRRRSADGSFNGVIGSSALISYFETFYADGGVPGDEFSIALVRSDGKVLVGFPHLPARRDLDPALFTAPERRFAMRSPDTGIERLYSFKKVKEFPVHVLYGIDRATIIAAWHRDLMLWSVITAASIASLLFAWSVVARRTADVERQVADRTAALARLLEEKEVLLREVHHRVKNNLQTIASMVRIVSRTGTREAQPAFQDIARRIATVGKAYDYIHRAEHLAELDLGAYLRSICHQVVAASGRDDLRLDLQADQLVTDIDTALPVGLIASELLTNACKRAFGGRASATIVVRFRIEGDHALLTVRDAGDGGAPVALAESSGLKIAEMLASQLEGRLRGKSRPGGGLQFRLTFPLAVSRSLSTPLRRAAM
jgi:two-component sensor histidine kinase